MEEVDARNRLDGIVYRRKRWSAKPESCGNGRQSGSGYRRRQEGHEQGGTADRSATENIGGATAEGCEVLYRVARRQALRRPERRVLERARAPEPLAGRRRRLQQKKRTM